jgi:hypothetical protein
MLTGAATNVKLEMGGGRWTRRQIREQTQKLLKRGKVYVLGATVYTQAADGKLARTGLW